MGLCDAHRPQRRGLKTPLTAWLTHVLAKLSDHPANNIDELLPWRWKAAQQAVAQPATATVAAERAAVLPHHPAAQSGSIRPCFRQTLYRCAQRPTNGTNKVEFWLPRRHINRERRLLLKKGLQIGLRLDDPIKNFATRVLPEYRPERCARRLCRNHEPCGGLWGMARATRRSRVILRSRRSPRQLRLVKDAKFEHPCTRTEGHPGNPVEKSWSNGARRGLISSSNASITETTSGATLNRPEFRAKRHQGRTLRP